MRIPLSWLKEYVDLVLSPEALAEKLTLAGMEVEKIEYIGVPGADLVWDREKLVVGQILEVAQHPNADKLVLATIEYGHTETEQVVTGAPNLFPYLGKGDLTQQKIYSPFALEGAVVYDGHKEGQTKMTLKGRKLRGIHNRCMVCSEKELGMSDEHEGIMFIEGNQTPGTPLQDLFGDVIYEIDIIPNIARCASIIGIAREVAAITGQTVRYPSYEVVHEGESIAGKIKLTTDNPELNPRFIGMMITGVEQKPSPQWMQQRLLRAGQRPINVVVDISNYVMLEMGQPNHTFDFDFLRRRADQYDPNGPIHINTRLPQPEETITTLDGEERQLPEYTILVTDPAGALSIGGVMGGADSEIQDDTINVLLEAAAWNYMNIRRSVTKLKLHSEAGFRFSRGVHASQALLGAKRAAELLRLYAGGTVAKGLIDYYPNPPAEVTLPLTTADVRRIAGLDLSLVEIKQMLENLEFVATITDDTLQVTVPDHRFDIEFVNDLVEEVCRMYGYDNIPTTNMADALPQQRNNVALEREERVRDLLVSLDMQEIITYRLTSPEREIKLYPGEDAPPVRYVELANPISEDRRVLRRTMLATALEVTAANSKTAGHIAFFELGKIYLPQDDVQLPEEQARLALILSGLKNRHHWDGGETTMLDFFDLKGLLEALLDELKIPTWHVEAAEHPSFRPGRTAALHIGSKIAGYFGEIHPLVKEQFGIRTEAAVLAADLHLGYLTRKMPARFTVVPPSEYPPVREDLALVVDQSLPAATVEKEIFKAGGFLLKSIELFDLYEGEQVAEGKKSLAYHLVFQAPDKTLKDKDTFKLRAKILKQLETKLGAQLR